METTINLKIEQDGKIFEFDNFKRRKYFANASNTKFNGRKNA